MSKLPYTTVDGDDERLVGGGAVAVDVEVVSPAIGRHEAHVLLDHVRERAPIDLERPVARPCAVCGNGLAEPGGRCVFRRRASGRERARKSACKTDTSSASSPSLAREDGWITWDGGAGGLCKGAEGSPGGRGDGGRGICCCSSWSEADGRFGLQEIDHKNRLMQRRGSSRIPARWIARTRESCPSAIGSA